MVILNYVTLFKLNTVKEINKTNEATLDRKLIEYGK